MTRRPFGEESRHALLDEYFHGLTITAANAWKHVYRLLMWIDRTTGLAHCYESDKCQPGRPWYGRALAFHGWLAAEMGIGPDEVGDQLDWMFQRALQEVRVNRDAQREKRAPKAAEQRGRYDENMPEPAGDPKASRLILDRLDPWLCTYPPAGPLGRLQLELWTEFAQENKRKNLLGEGFEDTIARILRSVGSVEGGWQIHVRKRLDELPGFSAPRRNEKPRTVDLAVIVTDGRLPAHQRRVLVTSKWSVRADREEQFAIDHNDYARLEHWGEDFEYVLLTNEFDPARLKAACERRGLNAALFDAVVHVHPDGLRAAYSTPDGRRGSSARETVLDYIDRGRILSLEDWISSLAGA